MAGLLSGLMGGGQGGGLLSDPMLRLQMGAQMMQGGSIGDQLGGAFGAAAQYGMQRKQMAEQMAEKNKTLDYLRQQDPELAQAVEAGVLDPASAYKAHLERAKPQQPDYMEVGGQLFNPANNQWIAPPPNPNDPGKKDPYMERQQAAQSLGLTPQDPAYQGFVLTGKMPREDQAPLTATDKQAILAADEAVLANQTAIDMLESVTSGAPGETLNDRAGSGMTAGLQSWMARNDPTGMFDDAQGAATTELNNVVLGQALASLKATFGAAPTEGERKILVDLQASINKTPQERKLIMDRAVELARKRLAFNQQRASELRGGTYYKPGTGLPSNQPTPQGSFTGTTSSGLQWGVEP